MFVALVPPPKWLKAVKHIHSDWIDISADRHYIYKLSESSGIYKFYFDIRQDNKVKTYKGIKRIMGEV